MKRWLQIKGDPQVRRFLFEQEREESLFDNGIDELHWIVSRLLVHKDVFHAKIHYSSNQLTCWRTTNPFCYEVFVLDEVFQPEFIDTFGPCTEDIVTPNIPIEEVTPILNAFKRLRMQDSTVYLRNASINMVNGRIGMTFSCDGSHYIPYEEFYETVERF